MTEATNKIYEQISNMMTQKFSEIDGMYKKLKDEHEKQVTKVVNRVEDTFKNKIAEVIKTDSQNKKLDKTSEKELLDMKQTIKLLQSDKSELTQKISTLEYQNSLLSEKYENEKYAHDITKDKYKLSVENSQKNDDFYSKRIELKTKLLMIWRNP